MLEPRLVRVPAAASRLPASLPLLAEEFVRVEGRCSSDPGDLIFRFGSAGKGTLSLRRGVGTEDCALEVEEIQGPPVSELAGDMLLIEADRLACASGNGDGRLLPEIFVQVYDQLTDEPSGRILAWRRALPAVCTITHLDLGALPGAEVPAGGSAEQGP